MSDIVTIIVTQTPTVQIYVNETGTGGAAAKEDKTDEFTGGTDLTLETLHTYVAGSIRLYKNGARLNAASYTESAANQITLEVERLEDDEFIVDYKKL